ncbi:hypothetical protein ACFYY8_27260 [Streptosporangium sp. NPDC001559]|uniref:hypothetical protein n=1 Tax=Streptosporangium sp. NPDC001559 TaxID=3366187 RepID=UPI0036E663C1
MSEGRPLGGDPPTSRSPAWRDRVPAQGGAARRRCPHGPGGRCSVEVFIADDPHSAGTAFSHLDDDTDPPHPGGPVIVDRAAHRADRVLLRVAGSPAGRLTLPLGDRPRDAAATSTVTAAAARAVCDRTRRRTLSRVQKG